MVAFEEQRTILKKKKKENIDNATHVSKSYTFGFKMSNTNYTVHVQLKIRNNQKG